MKDNSRVVKILDIVPYEYDQSAFEKLGFNFEPKGEETKITFPTGWVWKDIDNDAFTIDLIDEKGCSHGKICYGNYPRIRDKIWLYEEIRSNVMETHDVKTLLKEELKRN